MSFNKGELLAPIDFKNDLFAVAPRTIFHPPAID